MSPGETFRLTLIMPTALLHVLLSLARTRSTTREPVDSNMLSQAPAAVTRPSCAELGCQPCMKLTTEREDKVSPARNGRG
jgi:hypothetical protein